MHTQCDLDSFEVVYQDDYLVAIHKPAGLLVHRSPIDKRETQFALQMTRDLIGQRVYPFHRLDKATSGLLVFALDSQTANAMQQQFAEHHVQKTYLALTRGWAQETGHIDRPLIYKKDKCGDDGLQSEEPQEAVTDYRCLAQTVLDKPLGRFEQQRYSLVQLEPKTGRKQQIRRHLKHENLPIIGDVNHGDRHHNHLFWNWLGYHRLYLASTQLSFIHPVTLETMTLSAPLQADFQATLQALNLFDAVPESAIQSKS